MINKTIKNKDSGYILAFTLILMSILLTVSLSISKIIIREITYSRLVDSSKGAYFAADSGIECAQYLDSSFVDDTRGVSIILNSSPSNSQSDFSANLMNNVFFSTSTVFSAHTNFSNTDTIDQIKTKIVCASDDGSYNQIFNDNLTPYATTSKAVKDNLMNLKSSYNIEGDSTHATTTFGIVIRQTDSNTGNIINRCALVEFMKIKGTATDTTSYFSIASTGYSNCENNNLSKVSRTIYRYSTD